MSLKYPWEFLLDTEEQKWEMGRQKLTDYCETIRTGDTVRVTLDEGYVHGRAEVHGKRVVVAGMCTVRDVNGARISANIKDITILVKAPVEEPEPPVGSIAECDGCGTRFHRMKPKDIYSWIAEDAPNEEPISWRALQQLGTTCGKFRVVWTSK